MAGWCDVRLGGDGAVAAPRCVPPGGAESATTARSLWSCPRRAHGGAGESRAVDFARMACLNGGTYRELGAMRGSGLVGTTEERWRRPSMTFLRGVSQRTAAIRAKLCPFSRTPAPPRDWRLGDPVSARRPAARLWCRAAWDPAARHQLGPRRHVTICGRREV
jgi:hypothetical protein